MTSTDPMADLKMSVTAGDGVIHLTLGSLTLSLRPVEAERLAGFLLDKAKAARAPVDD